MTDLLNRAADAANHAYFANLHKPDPFAFVVRAVAREILTAPASEGMLAASTAVCEACPGDDCGIGYCGVRCYPAMAAALLAEMTQAATEPQPDRSEG